MKISMSGRRPFGAGLAASALAALTLALSGCGGSTPVPNPERAAATGRATLTIAWPARTAGSRLVPAAANSVVVRFRKDGKEIASQTVARPAGGGATTADFPVLPPGALTASADAYPNADGTGVLQATATVPVTIVPGQMTPVEIAMASTIDRVTVTPGQASVNVGLSATFTATALDAAGNVVLTAPSGIAWNSLDPGVATVDGAGTVTGAGVGAAQIQATETESGESAAVTVTVSPAGGSAQGTIQ